jgi:RimJ/RimL family protein N-acetyltransferase
MNVVPFQAWHLWEIDLQESQAQLMSIIDLDYALLLARSGPAITVFDDKECLGSCGIAMTGYTGAILWGFVSGKAGRRMIRIHRVVKRFTSSVSVRRIEATVQAGFDPGCRLMDLLGFEREGLMRCYGPDGADHYRYAKVSPWLK